MSTSFAACARRDPKGLYEAARQGLVQNFTGLDSPYEEPLHPDCEIDTEAVDLPQAIGLLLGVLFKK